MRFVIFYCILFWDAAPVQNGELRQYIFKKECYSTKAESKKELRKKVRYIEKKNYLITKIDTIYGKL